jgi:hypothetical protein
MQNSKANALDLSQCQFGWKHKSRDEWEVFLDAHKSVGLLRMPRDLAKADQHLFISLHKELAIGCFHWAEIGGIISTNVIGSTPSDYVLRYSGDVIYSLMHLLTMPMPQFDDLVRSLTETSR